MSRRLPRPLADHVRAVVVPSAVVLVVCAVLALVTVTNARRARAFEERGVRVEATVLGTVPTDGVAPRVRVVFAVGGEDRTAAVGSVDPSVYAPGERVDVRYDPDDPDAARLVDEPYDLVTPVTFIGAAAALALAAVASRWSRARRLVRLADTDTTTWRLRGRLVNRRPGPGTRRWLLLEALDAPPGSDAVAALPLLPGQAIGPRTSDLEVLVKGQLRNGAIAVAQVEGRTVWPAGPVRVPPPAAG